MIEWRNYKALHKKARARVKFLEHENTILKERVAFLEVKDKEKDSVIEDLRLQIEEVRRIVFGDRHDKEKQVHKKEEVRPDAGRAFSQGLPRSHLGKGSFVL